MTSTPMTGRQPGGLSVGPPRLDSLTSLRFFAAILAFSYHWWVFYRPQGLNHLLRGAPVTMEYFFVLSGFVLAWVWRPEDTARTFYQRRAARVYPNHVLLWVLFLGMLALQGKAAGPAASLAGLPLVQSWIPLRSVFFGVNGVMWSAAVEIFFYALFPFIIPVLARVRPERRKLLMATGLVAVVGYAIGHQILAPKDLYWIYVFPPLRLVEFALGILLAFEVREGRWPRVSLNTVVTLVALSYAVWVVIPPVVPGDAAGGAAFRLWPLAILPFMLFIGTIAIRDLQGSPSFLRWKPLVTLGDWSYAFYVVHLLVLKALAPYVHPKGLRGWLWGIVLLAVITALSGLLHRLWERPWERRLRPGRVPRANA